MKTGVAHDGSADGLTICSRYDDGVLVVDKIAGTAELYTWQVSGFYAAWNEPRTIDWSKVNATADGPQYDVIAHPKSGGE